MNPSARFVVIAAVVSVAACEPSTGPTRVTAAPNSSVLGAKGGSKCAVVTVFPSAVTLSIGGTITLVDTVANKKGVVLANELVTWASQSPAVATVSSNGVVTGISAGTASIVVTCESGLTASSSITVVP